MRRGHVILESFFKGAGHLFIIINYILYIPTLIVFAEVTRCENDNVEPGYEQIHFVCLQEPHTSLLVVSAISTILVTVIVVYTNFFINS